MGKQRSRSRAQSGASADTRGGSYRSPSLTSSERAYMIRKAKEASVALVDHAHTLDGPVQWHYTGKFRGIQMYRGEGSYDRVGTAGTEFLCGVTTMMGTIDEVAKYFDQQTTDEMVAKKADDVLDCAVLYALIQNDPQNPYYRVSAKYQLYEGPSAFSRERDYCFLECQNTFRHASGRRGWVLSMHSIKLPCCPEVEGVVRGSMYQSGYVFVEAEKEGYMDVMHSLQINFKSTSRLPHFLLNSALKRRILSVVTISREIQSSRMGRQTLLKKKELMPKRTRALCVNCSRKFSLFVRKTRCRVCGEVVCQPCAPQVMINVARGPPVKTRVCTKCYHMTPKENGFDRIGALPGMQQSDPRRYQNETRYSDILQDQPEAFREDDEDSLDEDEDEDGLEEQSDYSVFAQSRFTEASRDSVATTNRFDADDGASSIYSGTSTSYWQQESSVASSMMDWHQASSVKPVDGYIYDPQASELSSTMGSNFYGASIFTEDNYGKRTGQYNSTAAIPEDEPASHAHDESYASTGYGDPYASHATNESHASNNSKILSINKIAKARSARYGITSQFPPPPPPPPLSPPPEEEEEEEEDDANAPLDAGSLKTHNTHFSTEPKKKERSKSGSRKMFTPPKEERPRSSRSNASRVPPKAPRKKDFESATVNKEEGVRVSHIDSMVFGNTRSSAILQQVRRNRNRTLQFTPESDRQSAVLKSLEEEHLARMREIERMQALAKEKATARKSNASNGSQRNGNGSQRNGSQHPSARNDRYKGSALSDSDRVNGSTRSARSHRSSRRSQRSTPPGSPPGAPPSSRPGPPPKSPPGKPRNLQNRAAPRTPPQSPPRSSARIPSSRGNRNLNDLRRTDVSNEGSLQRSQFSSRSSNTSFTKSKVRVSVTPSSQMEDFAFSSNRSLDFRISAGLSKSSDGDRRFFNASQASSAAHSQHSEDLAFDASQLSLDKSKFSSSIAILETPDEAARKSVAMMEGGRTSNTSTLLEEDMTRHINSMRARNAYQLPEEEPRASDEMKKREEEHKRRMEELARITVGHVEKEDIRDSTSTLGGLHDSAVSLSGPRNMSASQTNSLMSSSLMDSMISEDFDFEDRPLGRTKRSGTIPFSMDELQGSMDEVEEEASNHSSERSRGLSHDEDDHASPRSSERSRGLSLEEIGRGSEHSSEYSRGLSIDVSERSSERSRGLSYEPTRDSERSSERSRGLSHDVEEDQPASERSSERSRGLSHDVEEYAVSECSSERSRGLSHDVEEEKRVSEQSSEGYRRSHEASEDKHANMRSSERSTGVEYEMEEYESASDRSSEGYRLSHVEEDDKLARLSESFRLSKESKPANGRSSERSTGIAFDMEEYDFASERASEEYRLSHEVKDMPLHEDYRLSYDMKEDEPVRSSEHDAQEEGRVSEHSSGHEEPEVEHLSDHAWKKSSHASSKSSHADSKSSHASGKSSRSSSKASDHSSVRSSEYSGRLSNEQPVAPKESLTSKFEPYSSQLMLGDGGSAVDEFFADESRVIPSNKLSLVDESHDGEFGDNSATRASENTVEENLEFMPTLDEDSTEIQPKEQNYSSSSTEPSEHVSSPRESCASNLSALDEELMNRPTEDLFELVRANRTRKWEPTESISELHDGGGRSSEVMLDIEESHRRRMEELNRIALDHLGNRISNLDDDLFDSSYRPSRLQHSSSDDDDDDDQKAQWRSTMVMDQYQNNHQREMETLRRKIRQLEEECRESFASVLTPEELMDMSELEDDDESPADVKDRFNSSANGGLSMSALRTSGAGSSKFGSSFMSTDSLSMSSTQPMPPQMNEPVPARVLYEQIAQLTQLQREMAEAEDDTDEEEYRARIKEQYKLLRSIKVQGRASARMSTSSISIAE